MAANLEPDVFPDQASGLPLRCDCDESLALASASNLVCDLCDYDHLLGLLYATGEQVLEPNKGL